MEINHHQFILEITDSIRAFVPVYNWYRERPIFAYYIIQKNLYFGLNNKIYINIYPKEFKYNCKSRKYSLILQET